MTNSAKEPFDPTSSKGQYEVGQPIQWHHVSEDGSVIKRTGAIWSLAPTLRGSRTLWVVPDEHMETDLYSSVVVIVVPKGRRHRATRVSYEDFSGRKVYKKGPVIGSGEAWSSDDPLTDVGAATLAGAPRQRANVVAGTR